MNKEIRTSNVFPIIQHPLVVKTVTGLTHTDFQLCVMKISSIVNAKISKFALICPQNIIVQILVCILFIQKPSTKILTSSKH